MYNLRYAKKEENVNEEKRSVGILGVGEIKRVFDKLPEPHFLEQWKRRGIAELRQQEVKKQRNQEKRQTSDVEGCGETRRGETTTPFFGGRGPGSPAGSATLVKHAASRPRAAEG
ncbi:hypothetical protein CRV24_002705 [Beauveria bassiana]|nr:hypothetical protein CRV24_002705 [Beauveria bassiana]